MDKRLILAVAGSGKTTYIVNSLSKEKKSLIVTYTTANYENLKLKIIEKYENYLPENIVLMTYFQFIYSFCYKPFLSDLVKAKGIWYESNENLYCKKENMDFFITENRYLYSNRIAFLIEQKGYLFEVKKRLEKYFDEFIIDEIQDIAGRDFEFLKNIMDVNINMLFVGDFYQHTFDTSRDGIINKNLYNDLSSYISIFENKGFSIDKSTLVKSWRCSKNICEFVTDKMHITINSNRNDSTIISLITDDKEKESILSDNKIIKLHYNKSDQFGICHKNWGQTKGEDCYDDVCIILNDNTYKHFNNNNLYDLPQSTKNKLYVAITRAHKNVFFVK